MPACAYSKMGGAITRQLMKEMKLALEDLKVKSIKMEVLAINRGKPKQGSLPSVRLRYSLVDERGQVLRWIGEDLAEAGDTITLARMDQAFIVTLENDLPPEPSF